MAIQAEYNTYNGRRIEDAYIKVGKIRIEDKVNLIVELEVREDKNDEFPFEVFRKEYSYDLESTDNVQTTIYNVLKTEFPDSIDV